MRRRPKDGSRTTSTAPCAPDAGPGSKPISGSCPACRAYRDGLARLQAAAGRPADRSPEYWAGFERRLEAKLDAVGSGRRPPPHRVRRPERWAWAAAAFSVLAAAGGLWLVLRPAGAG